ncbi:MAG: hypothetical protein FD189_2403 [Elusimicrobia bacterium]|nr:MAG: hypothetical protein FD154_2270 [Elusimicrobiota bacterium]KAF0153178.1 MAG: hypothetical protein FD189_2403 [Elusimicrobiota bacterium]
MGMKLKQLIAFLLVIPFLASSVNLAAASQALDNLNAAAANADRSYDGAGNRAAANLYVKGGGATIWTKPDASAPKEKTAGEKIKETLSKNKTYITTGLVGGLMGFLLFGPAGIIGGVLIGIAARMYAKLI